MNDRTSGIQAIVPPQAIDAEQAIIGALLQSPSAWDKIAGLVSAQDFYRADHRQVMLAIETMTRMNQPCDVITVGVYLRQQRPDFNVDYLVDLANSLGSAANIEAYAEIVREKSMLRSLIDASTESIRDAYTSDESPQVVMARAEQRLLSVTDSRTKQSSLLDMHATMKQLFVTIHGRYEQKSPLVGIGTGFPELDALLSGLQNGDLIVIASRPSMGKTALALNIGQHVACNLQVPVTVFSMEMSNLQLGIRLVSAVGRIDGTQLQSANLDEHQWPALSAAIGVMAQAPLFIDDAPALSPMEVRAKARRQKREHGLGLIIIDYLQLMRSGGRPENRTAEIAEISRSLKALAKELNVPVIVLSQLNRSLEQRADKRPMMSDLRESGAIEQDADVIMFIYRDEYYNKESPDAGHAEVIVAKQRMGPCDTVKLAFHGAHTRFENLGPPELPAGVTRLPARA